MLNASALSSGEVSQLLISILFRISIYWETKKKKRKSFILLNNINRDRTKSLLAPQPRSAALAPGSKHVPGFVMHVAVRVRNTCAHWGRVCTFPALKQK